MKNFKRLLAMILVCIMVLPLNLFALEADSNVSANWNTMAAKYSKGTWKIIAPKSGNYAIKSEGFTFTEDAEGGIKVVTPDYKTFAGTYGTSVVSSKNTTPLDGLSVVIQPDEFDSMVDSIDAGNSLNVLWTENPITEIAGFNDASKAYDAGLYTAVSAYSNGLRHIIPTVTDATPLTPASKAPAGTTNGKALSIRVTCDKAIGEDFAPVATSVSIVYYDGYYINDDGHPGYRWTFAAMNHEDSKLGDASTTSTVSEALDLSNGLAINVRADDRLGYIININGYDYYKGEEIGFFPDCDTNWVGYKTNELTDDSILNNDPIWATSMRCARQDIDLSDIKDVAEGYLTIGAVSINDQNLTDHRCNYTVKSINGVPAADWAGGATAAHECDYKFVETIGGTCTRDGYDYYRCTVCGAADKQNVVTAVGHTPKEDVTVILKPTCSTYGTSSRNCFVCKTRLETYHDAPVAHTFDSEWTIVEEATCQKDGKRTNTCSVCAAAVEEVITAEHNYEWVVIKEATCLEAGAKTGVCKTCGAESGTVEIPSDNSHKFSESTPVIETIDGSTDWFGKVAGTCTVCGEVAESTEDMYANVKHFTDVKENAWFMSEVAFCVRQGLVSGMSETTFAPNANLTRAQFLTLLAKFDGVDLTKYDTTDAGFEDVKTSHWFNEVVCWAVENEYTSGISATKFGPSNNITRSQLARFFMVYTEKEGLDVSKTAELTAFSDASKVQAWAAPAVKWAVAEGLIAGSNGKLDPNGNATRAQAARIFMMYANTEFAVVEPPVCEHVWGEWVVTVEPQVGVAGEQTATCTLCGETKTEEIPGLEVPSPEVKDFVITLDPDGGVMDEGFVTEMGINYGDDYNDAIGDYPTATKEGYTLLGWLLEAYGFLMNKDEWDNGTYALTGDCTLVAVWEEVEVPAPAKDYNITFALYDEDVADGAKIDGTDETSVSYGINYGDYYKDLFAYPTATKDGYDFVGWLLEQYGFVLNDAEYAGNYYALTGDCTLYAIFEEAAAPAKDWKLIFDTNGGVMPEGVPTEMGINTNENYKEATGFDYPVPTLEGYDFAGWYWELYNFTLTEGDWNGGWFAVAMDVEFLALWEEAAEPAKDYTIRLFIEDEYLEMGAKIDGTDATELLIPINMGDDYNDVYGDFPTASLAGYDFQGWYLDMYGFLMNEGEWNGGSYAVPGDCELYAIFEEAEVPAKDYVMRLFIEDEYVEMGAKIDGTDATELLVPLNLGDDYNDAYGDFPTASLAGYDFQGWYLEMYGFLMNEGEWNGNSYAVPSDCELYAIFEEAYEEPELPVYNENGVDGYLAVGTADYDLSADYQYSIFEFSPTEEGEYTIATDNLVGIVSYNGMWVSFEPSAETVADTSVVWECTGVGQTIWVAVKGGTATANIAVTKADVEPEPVVEYVTYENVVTPEAFAFDGDAAALVNVAFDDETVDVVVDVDGVYHLGTADGPVVYVNLADAKMNLSDAMGFGQLKGSTVVDGVVTTITDYNTAYGEYVACADANGLYPLTVDLVTILKEVGKYQGWYVEGGWIASTEDAWMFPCYYAEVTEPTYEFTITFDVTGVAPGYPEEFEHGVIVNDAPLTYTINLGDKYSDVITTLPIAEKEGYVFKGWWNRTYRIALTPDFDAEKAFDLYLKLDSETGLPEEDIETMDKNIELVPIWDVEGEKDYTITFENWDVDGFEPIVYKMNVGDFYMSIFAGEFPDPIVYNLDEYTVFQGWYIEELGFLLSEGDMWDLGNLALDGDWTFTALYVEE